MFFALRTSPLVLTAMLALLLRGRWLGVQWSLSDTVLATYLVETLFSDGVTLFALRGTGWRGQWRVSWSSFGLEIFPTLDELMPRMRRLGMTQLSVPLVGSGLSAIWFLTGSPAWWSHSAMVLLTSVFVLMTTLLPAIPRLASAGSALDRLRTPRWARANWVWAATLRAVDSGAVLANTVRKADLEPLLAPPTEPLDAMSLLYQCLCCELEDFAAARPLVERWLTEQSNLPAWLAVDGLKQAGAFYALVDRDFARSEEHLRVVKERQIVPWYAELLQAAIAHARGDAATGQAALTAWHRAVAEHPRQGLLLGANRWILSTLEAPTPKCE